MIDEFNQALLEFLGLQDRKNIKKLQLTIEVNCTPIIETLEYAEDFTVLAQKFYKVRPVELTEVEEKIGSWLSAALDDDSVCDEMKADIRAWMDKTQ